MHFDRRFVHTNGIRMHFAEAGSGPLVLLCHGFPESWYSWRHQLTALAQAGFHAVAPDLRGYGQTDCPDALEAYDIFQLTGDLVGLVNVLGDSSAVIVGHDWGAAIAAHAALFRPDLFRALALLSVPYVPRRTVNQTEWERQTYPGKSFYQANLRSPAADAHLRADVRASLVRALWTLSGDVEPQYRWKFVRDPNDRPVETPLRRPDWLAEEDLAFLVAEFERSGFTGGLNYYRNMDRNWKQTPFLDGAKILQPALFIAGENDPVIEFLRREFDDLGSNLPNLRRKLLLERTGHWTQQEQPEKVTRLLIEFVSDLS